MRGCIATGGGNLIWSPVTENTLRTLKVKVEYVLGGRKKAYCLVCVRYLCESNVTLCGEERKPSVRGGHMTRIQNTPTLVPSSSGQCYTIQSRPPPHPSIQSSVRYQQQSIRSVPPQKATAALRTPINPQTKVSTTKKSRRQGPGWSINIEREEQADR